MSLTFDAHIHMVLDGADFRKAIDRHRPTPDDAAIRRCLAEYRRRGVTYLRDGGDAWGVSLRARALAEEYGICYRSPAFPIYKKGHYGAFIGRGFSEFDEYRALLDEAQAADCDFVKLMLSGLIDFSRPDTLTECGLTAEEIAPLIDEAHARGLAVMVHANGDVPVTAALESGAESIEHGAFLSEATLCRLAESDTVWVPTLSTICNPIGCGRYPDSVLRPLLCRQQEKVCFAARRGAKIAQGSDAGAFRVLHGQAVEDEYALLRQVLGAQTDGILAAGEAAIRRAF